jgi:hypothetical protein
MMTITIIMLIGGIVLGQAFFWLAIFWWTRRKSQRLALEMTKEFRRSNEAIIIGPTSGLYRGSTAGFGKVKGNGVICLTKNKLIFEKLTGQKIEIDRSEIEDAEVKASFRGKSSFATGGKHLVIRTRDGGLTGFLLKDAEQWARRIKPKR